MANIFDIKKFNDTLYACMIEIFMTLTNPYKIEGFKVLKPNSKELLDLIIKYRTFTNQATNTDFSLKQLLTNAKLWTKWIWIDLEYKRSQNDSLIKSEISSSLIELFPDTNQLIFQFIFRNKCGILSLLYQDILTKLMRQSSNKTFKFAFDAREIKILNVYKAELIIHQFTGDQINIVFNPYFQTDPNALNVTNSIRYMTHDVNLLQLGQKEWILIDLSCSQYTGKSEWSHSFITGKNFSDLNSSSIDLGWAICSVKSIDQQADSSLPASLMQSYTQIKTLTKHLIENNDIECDPFIKSQIFLC